MNEIKFHVSWSGEPDAGLRAGYEDVTIKFSTGWKDEIPQDTVEDFRQALLDIYDGAIVQTAEEHEEEMRGRLA